MSVITVNETDTRVEGDKIIITLSQNLGVN